MDREENFQMEKLTSCDGDKGERVVHAAKKPQRDFNSPNETFLQAQLTSFLTRVNIVHWLLQPWCYFDVFLHKLWDVALYNYITADESTGILYL